MQDHATRAAATFRADIQPIIDKMTDVLSKHFYDAGCLTAIFDITDYVETGIALAETKIKLAHMQRAQELNDKVNSILRGGK